MRITHFTDPACPWAFSAEPARLQLAWHYGDQLEWRTVLVGLSNSTEEMEAKGFDPAKMAGFAKMIQAKFGMPIEITERSRLAISMPACRAVVAVRLHRPEAEEAVLRAVRVHSFGGALLDEQSTLDAAAADAGVTADELAAWVAEPATEEALAADLAAARSPHAAALLLDHKLADSGSDVGASPRRYTCPSMEFSSGDVTLAAPGMQPWETYDVLVANVDPTLTRRDAPGTVEELRGWAPYPLATAEVAALRGISTDAARLELQAIGVTYSPVGEDGYWSL